MTVKQALSRARQALLTHNVEDASLESELLLRHTLNISRVQLYLDLDQELNPKQASTFYRLVKQRLSHQPTAYITEHREFYGLDFSVSPNVLIPRPETELLVEKALSLAPESLSTIADIGTGCGAIAISLALKLPQAKLYATDISAAALKVAQLNCQKHGVADRVYLLQGDLLGPLPQPVDLIIANLPYVKERELVGIKAAKFEPRLALNGGTDGLHLIRSLCWQVGEKLSTKGHLLLEIGQRQAKEVTRLLRALFPSAEIEILSDLGSIDRVVSLHLSA